MLKPHDVWEEHVIIRSEVETENVCFLGFQDIREGVTLRRLILWRLEYILVGVVKEQDI